MGSGVTTPVDRAAASRCSRVSGYRALRLTGDLEPPSAFERRGFLVPTLRLRRGIYDHKPGIVRTSAHEYPFTQVLLPPSSVVG